MSSRCSHGSNEPRLSRMRRGGDAGAQGKALSIRRTRSCTGVAAHFSSCSKFARDCCVYSKYYEADLCPVAAPGNDRCPHGTGYHIPGTRKCTAAGITQGVPQNQTLANPTHRLLGKSGQLICARRLYSCSCDARMPSCCWAHTVSLQ